MNAPKIKQQDAAALAAGYSRWFRAVEVLAILAFGLAMVLLIRKLAPFWDESAWLIVGAGALGFIFADLASGIVHWAADTWGSPDIPVLGKALLRPFREHHVAPKAMTKHDYIETNGANCLVALPIAYGTLAIPVEPDSTFALGLSVSMGSMIFWVMMTNQIHKWSHLDQHELPALVRFAQRFHLILPPTHHVRHHTAPFDTYYCITTGWLNRPLHRMGFFRALERIIISVTGALPRRDDIGVDAALAIAPTSTPIRPNEHLPQG